LQKVTNGPVTSCQRSLLTAHEPEWLRITLPPR
jgi:hypothetical protein